jgi:hypothetical protein
LNLPDGGLKELDPWTIEKSIRDELLRTEPHVRSHLQPDRDLHQAVKRDAKAS